MKKKSIAKNYVYNLVFQLLTIVTPLITTPYICRVLGAENNGIYGYTLSIVTYFVLFGTLGTSMYGQREIAYVQDNKENQTKLFWEIMLVKAISYVFVLVAFIVLFCLDGDYSLYYKILCIELLSNLIDISWFFQGNEEFDKTVIRNIIIKVTGLVLIFIFVKDVGDLWKYFLIYVLSNFLGNLSLWFYLPKYLNKNGKKPSLKKHIKPIISMFIPQIAIQIYSVLDKTMVGKITNNMTEVAYYDQAQKIIKALLLVVSAMSTVMCSRIAYSYSKNKINDIKKYLLQSVKMVWLIATPFVFGIIAISTQLVPLYFGPGYEPVVLLMNVTTLILFAIGLNNVTGIQYLIQTNKQNIFTISVTIAAFVNLVLNFIFIKMFGTIGAVYSSVLAEFLILFIQLVFIKDVLTLKDIMYSSIKYLLSSIVMFIVVFILKSYLSISIIALLLEICVGGIVYIVMLLILRDKFFFDLINQVLTTLRKRS